MLSFNFLHLFRHKILTGSTNTLLNKTINDGLITEGLYRVPLNFTSTLFHRSISSEYDAFFVKNLDHGTILMMLSIIYR